MYCYEFELETYVMIHGQMDDRLIGIVLWICVWVDDDQKLFGCMGAALESTNPLRDHRVRADCEGNMVWRIIGEKKMMSYRCIN